jgi:hypothetical protein
VSWSIEVKGGMGVLKGYLPEFFTRLLYDPDLIAEMKAFQSHEIIVNKPKYL